MPAPSSPRQRPPRLHVGGALCAALLFAGCGDDALLNPPQLAGGLQPPQESQAVLQVAAAEEPGVARVAATAPDALESTRAGEDWPQFLGPRDTSVSGETGLLERWDEQGPPLLWHRRLGDGYSPPSVRGERLVVHHRFRDSDRVECLHAQTGETLWKYDYPTDFADPYGYDGGSRCAPVLTATRCYTYGPQGKLLCLDLASGEKVWERDTNADWQVPSHFFGAGCTPVLDGDRLFVLVGGQPNSGVVAFNAQTGETLWESVGKDTWDGAPTDEPGRKPYRWEGDEMIVSYSTPLVATIHGQQHLVCLLRQGLVSLDPATGKLRFKYWFRSKTHESVNAARPLVVGDRIFLSAAYETGAALLQVQPDGQSVKEVWRNKRGMSTHWSTAVHLDGYVYGFSGRHEPEAKLQCIRLDTGELQWETSGFDGDINDLTQDPNTGKITNKQTGKAVPWPFYGRGSLLLADGKFFVQAERGPLALVTPDPKQFVEVCRAAIPHLGYPSWAAPVLSRGRLFLRSEHDLVCLDVARPPGKK